MKAICTCGKILENYLPFDPNVPFPLCHFFERHGHYPASCIVECVCGERITIEAQGDPMILVNFETLHSGCKAGVPS